MGAKGIYFPPEADAEGKGLVLLRKQNQHRPKGGGTAGRMSGVTSRASAGGGGEYAGNNYQNHQRVFDSICDFEELNQAYRDASVNEAVPARRYGIRGEFGVEPDRHTKRAFVGNLRSENTARSTSRYRSSGWSWLYNSATEWFSTQYTAR
jgi:hypothetical protein